MFAELRYLHYFFRQVAPGGTIVFSFILIGRVCAKLGVLNEYIQNKESKNLIMQIIEDKCFENHISFIYNIIANEELNDEKVNEIKILVPKIASLIDNIDLSTFLNMINFNVQRYCMMVDSLNDENVPELASLYSQVQEAIQSIDADLTLENSRSIRQTLINFHSKYTEFNNSKESDCFSNITYITQIFDNSVKAFDNFNFIISFLNLTHSTIQDLSNLFHF